MASNENNRQGSTSSHHAQRRRRSRLMSGFKDDWAYSPITRSSSSSFTALQQSKTFSISLRELQRSATMFAYKKPSAPVPCVLSIDVPMRFLAFSTFAFPTMCISRFVPVEPSALQLCTSFFENFYIEFSSVESRDECIKLLKSLNALGGMVSSLYASVRDRLQESCDELSQVPSLRMDPTIVELPTRFPVDETDFVLWFLHVVATSDKIDSRVLAREIRTKLLPQQGEESDAAQERIVFPKHGELVENLILEKDEHCLHQEDFTTLLSSDKLFGRAVLGELYLTNHKLHFSSYMQEPKPNKHHVALVPSLRFGRRPQPVFLTVQIPVRSISHMSVQRVNKQQVVQICTHLGKVHRFVLDREHGFAKTYLGRIHELLAEPLRFSSSSLLAQDQIYSPQREFVRQGEHFTKLVANAGVCDTYPTYIALPKQFDAGNLPAAAKFRSRNRMPAVTWQNSTVTLSRSSQPMPGLTFKSNKLDEDLLRMLNVRFVVDCRGPLAVLGNTIARGKGVESLKRYPDVSLLFVGIGNIHTMRAAAAAAEIEVNKPADWLSHLQKLSQAALRVAEILILEQSSVLVHCSDGWDRTSQLVALAQVLVDPYYRTLRGLACLVEKDFCQFGFQFAKRCCGHKPYEKSPIWQQFVECLWEIQRQFPSAFEYNQDCLLFLCSAPFNQHKFGTLAFDTLKQREAAGAGEDLWRFMINEPEFLNKGFVPVNSPLWIDASGIIIWEAWHRRGDPGYFIL